MLYKLLGLSNSYLRKWAKPTAYFCLLVGIVMIAISAYLFSISNSWKNNIYPEHEQLSIVASEIKFETEKDERLIRYLAKEVEEISYTYANLAFQMALFIALFSVTFLFIAALFFKLNVLVNQTEP